MNNRKSTAFIAAMSLLALGACAKKEAAPDNAPAAEQTAEAQTEAPASSTSAGPDYSSIAEAALDNPARSDEDRANDKRRKALSTLVFFQVRPGENVFEMEAGGGYYTELLSDAVGPDGHVTMQNPQEFLKYVDKDIDKRLADNRLPNVTQSISPFDKLDASDDSADLVTWVQGPHDIWVENKEGGIFADPNKSFDEIYRILKPGGTFVVIDHNAEPGAPPTTGNTLHRIDPKIVVDLAQKAGFIFETESLILSNPDDDLKTSVFDKSIRGHTSQFALRFKKPAAE